jgi:hypothetical protein
MSRQVKKQVAFARKTPANRFAATSLTKPIPNRHHRHWLHRERRHHYPREALGVDYGSFDVVLPAPPERLLKAATPTTPEQDVSNSEEVRVPEGEEMPHWMYAILCSLLIFVCSYFLWALRSPD